MRSLLRKLTPSSFRRERPCVPPGERVYAVGDVHGELDLFRALRDAIEADNGERGPAQTTVILLGDLVDRGPASAQVLQAARAWRRRRDLRIVCGNHEEMFLSALEDQDIFSAFLRYGGSETLMSYLADPDVLDTLDVGEAHELLCESVPDADRAFMAGFEDSVTVGDYVFVHAGIRPGLPMEHQSPSDLRWIREPFLRSRKNHGHVIVHGHTITDEPEIRPNRIGIDTGAYRSGRLTALGLEGTDRWMIEARTAEDGIWVEIRALPERP